jgi:hypothetical protein
MTDYDDFEEEEAQLFANEDPDEQSASKGWRLVPSQPMTDLMAWIQDYHPEIRGFYELTYQDVEQLIHEFASLTGYRSDYTAEEWWRSLQR